MKDHYKKSCDLILKYKDHKEPLIRRSVVTLIPAMGIYDTQAFQELFLSRSMSHLLLQLQRPNERDAGVLPSSGGYYRICAEPRSAALSAFLAIGHLAVQLAGDIRSFTEEIIANIKDALSLRG
jgi:FKBP12-rapamycin complex-associated protein